MQSLHHKLGEGVAGKGQEEDKDDTGRDWSSTDGFLPLSEGFHFQTFQKQNKTKNQPPPQKKTNPQVFFVYPTGVKSPITSMFS